MREKSSVTHKKHSEHSVILSKKLHQGRHQDFRNYRALPLPARAGPENQPQKPLKNCHKEARKNPKPNQRGFLAPLRGAIRSASLSGGVAALNPRQLSGNPLGCCAGQPGGLEADSGGRSDPESKGDRARRSTKFPGSWIPHHLTLEDVPNLRINFRPSAMPGFSII